MRPAVLVLFNLLKWMNAYLYWRGNTNNNPKDYEARRKNWAESLQAMSSGTPLLNPETEARNKVKRKRGLLSSNTYLDNYRDIQKLIEKSQITLEEAAWASSILIKMLKGRELPIPLNLNPSKFYTLESDCETRARPKALPLPFARHSATPHPAESKASPRL